MAKQPSGETSTLNRPNVVTLTFFQRISKLTSPEPGVSNDDFAFTAKKVFLLELNHTVIVSSGLDPALLLDAFRKLFDVVLLQRRYS